MSEIRPMFSSQKEIFRMENIYVQNILEDAHLNVMKGEIVGLLGLNNSGKSVFMQVASGFYPHHKGRIYFEESKLPDLTPASAVSLGIHYISRENALLETFDVAENIYVMPRSRLPHLFVNHSKITTLANELLQSYQINISADTMVHELTLLKKIFVLILKAVSQKAKLIIIDHLLSNLSYAQLMQLKELINKIISQSGVSFILVGHHVSSLAPLCNRIFILREGQIAGSYFKKDFDEKTLNAVMIGYRIDPKRLRNAKQTFGKKIFELKNVPVFNTGEVLSFSVHQNEIAGLCCLNPDFDSHFLSVMLGYQNHCGQIFVDGIPSPILSPQDTLKSGIGIVSGENEMFPNLNIFDNITIASLKKNSSNLGIIKKSSSLFSFNETLFDIKDNKLLFIKNKFPSPHNKLQNTRITICRNLSINPKIMIYINPSNGMDIISANQLHNLIVSLTGNDRSSLIVSSNIHELLSICDRIIFVNQGKVVRSLNTHASTYDEILNYYNTFCCI